MEATDLNDNNERLVSVGRIRRAVGLDGRVEVELYSENSGDLGESSPDQAESRLSEGASFVADGRSLTVERAKNSRKGLFSVYFTGVKTRDASENLRGLELEVLESDLPPLPAGEYYHYQLIGCTVVDLSGHEIGELSGIMETGANDVYIVSNDAGRETMVPATKDVVKEVDTVKRTVTVDLPQAATATPE